uniref:Uncharacterized protein n=1 Tax=Lates calcarifer TaxID=8187 RepID=A0A4W6DTR3_LATCA
ENKKNFCKAETWLQRSRGNSPGRAALDSVFFCVQITRFVCIFSIFLLCYAPSQPSLRPML